MDAARFLGRVGGLAVALGVGAAVATGTGVAWASEDSDGAAAGGATSQPSGPSAGAADPETDDGATADDGTGDPETGDPESGEVETDTADLESGEIDTDTADLESGEVETDTADPDADRTEDLEAGDGGTEAAGTRRVPAERRRGLSAVEQRAEAVEQPSAEPAVVPVETADAPTGTKTPAQAAPRPDESAGESVAVVPATPAPHVPSWRPWPTAFDLRTGLTYVEDLVTSVVDAALRPFVAGSPPAPADPSAWGLLAWVRREFDNATPRGVGNPLPHNQIRTADGEVLVTGNLGVRDADDDPLTYTLIGRPVNGGTVSVDHNGDFVYRPMNAMAALGGTDTFTVRVSDETAGLHVHGLLGLLDFVPILGDLLRPGGGHSVARTVTVRVEPVAGVDLGFPDDFHWGVAHSGFQAEGGPGSPVDPRSDWYRWVHDPVNRFLGLVGGVPENGPGAYVSYESDAVLAREELGMNTFRIGIEWSRIFPESTAAVDISDEGGAVSLADLRALDELADPDEVAHYRAVLDALRAHGLEPMVTVNHFTLPVWVHDPIAARPLAQLGLPAPAAGWLSSGTPAEFEKYAAYLAWKYGDQVDNWVTLNEPFPPVLTEFLAIPGVVPNWPPGVLRPDLASTFLVNEAVGHVAAYDAIHAWDTTAADDDGPAAFVGFTHNMIPARPANPVSSLDAQAAEAWNHYYNGWFPNAVIDGWVDVDFDGVKTTGEIFPNMADKVDFLGVQYYGSQPMVGFGVAPVPGFPFLRGFPIRCSPASASCSDFNQPIDPGGFREVLEVAASYGKPLWITENGIADAADTKRPPYLVNHIAVVQDLLAHGSDIRGYTYWSFVDNLEWADGYHLQFGLYGSDPHTPELERTPKPASIAAISAITTSNMLPWWLLEQYLPD
ncbi:MAG: family 1 glycosylhydrolase [Actinomycetota bacterium]|nr:family 1 glycosylhydrolase [Actinomycetota bacterium]